MDIKFKFYLITLHPPMLPNQGLPQEEMVAPLYVWNIPASMVMDKNLLPLKPLVQLLETPEEKRSKLQLLSVATGFWAAQEQLIKELKNHSKKTQTKEDLDLRGLAPLSARSFESFCLSDGLFIWGCISRNSPSMIYRAFEKMEAAQTPTPIGPFTMPWLMEFSNGGSWVAGVRHVLQNVLKN